MAYTEADEGTGRADAAPDAPPRIAACLRRAAGENRHVAARRTRSSAGATPVRRRGVRFSLALAVAVALLIGVNLTHRILDSARGTPLEGLYGGPLGVGIPPAAEANFVELAQLFGGARLVGGNTVELLTEADASYAALFADLRAARRSITLQTYYCLPGRVADTTAAILAERARAGVRVLMLGDGYGCRLFPPHHTAAMRAAGVEQRVLRPLHWYSMHKAQHRSHVRLAVIDGVIAYTGGFGIDDKWLYGTSAAPAWRDTNVRVRGPVVRQAQAAFALAWAEATRELIIADDFFAHADSAVAGAVLAGVQFAGPGFGTTAFERQLFLAIGAARERLWIANAYFLPNRAQRAQLMRAAAAGVDVRVLTAGGRSDVPSTRFAARGCYRELLEGGVRIFEYGPTMMHAKTLIADGIWGMVGTMNFDNRSMRLDDELNLLFHDATVGRTLELSFEYDLLHAREVRLSEHLARPLRERLVEWAARLAEPLM
jgi:cardiolipin synthase A/B